MIPQRVASRPRDPNGELLDPLHRLEDDVRRPVTPLRFILRDSGGKTVLNGRPGGFALDRGGDRIRLGSVSEVNRSGPALRMSVESQAGLARVDLRWRDARTLELAFVPPAEAAFDRLCQSIELVDDGPAARVGTGSGTSSIGGP